MFFSYLPICEIRSALTAPFQEPRPSANGQYSLLNVCSSGALNNSPATILFRSIDACKPLLTQSHVTGSCCYCSPQVLALQYCFVHKTVFRGLPRSHTQEYFIATPLVYISGSGTITYRNAWQCAAGCFFAIERVLPSLLKHYPMAEKAAPRVVPSVLFAPVLQSRLPDQQAADITLTRASVKTRAALVQM
jgi:hypothetical protein